MRTGLDSTSKCNTSFRLVVNPFRCLIIKSFSWSLVELVGDPIALSLRDVGQTESFGQVLSDQSVGVLVGASLP